MDPLIQREDEENKMATSVPQQAALFALHSFFGLAAWIALMVIGSLLHPPQVSQGLILILCICVPLFAGFAVNRIRQDEVASTVWLFGLVIFLIMAVYVLDLPTGPNACDQCDATDKLVRTFFSMPSPSGLMDNDGPFFATWPAAALIGYSIGAKMGLKQN